MIHYWFKGMVYALDSIGYMYVYISICCYWKLNRQHLFLCQSTLYIQRHDNFKKPSPGLWSVKTKLMKVVMPKQFEIKNSAGVAPEGTSHRDLAALCNAGGLDGLRSIHDRPRPNKVSIGRGKSCLKEATRGESICARSVAKTSAWVPDVA
jgi:hypothetical protein